MLMPIAFSLFAISVVIASWSERKVSSRDRRLLERIQAGDTKAFDELYKNYQQYVTKLIKKFISIFSAAYSYLDFNEEDIVAIVKLELFKSLTCFRKEVKLTTWIYTIVKWAFIQYRKDEVKIVGREVPLTIYGTDGEPMESDILEPGLSPVEVLLKNEQECQLKEAIRSLPDEFRIAYILCEIEGIDYQVAADTLHIPIGTVRSRISRAKHKLRTVLGSGFMFQ